ncbi:GTPase [[Eubacterium] cellulosolvens]
MPANLTPEARGKWEKAISTKDPDQKLKAFQEFLSAIPKHKGNENLRDQVKRKIATLREEIEIRKQKKGHISNLFLIEKEGAAQILIIGPPNVGKSSLLWALTNARPEIAPYPRTTNAPVPGMMAYKDIKFMLVEIPALIEGKIEPQTLEMIKKADGLIILLDFTTDLLTDFKLIQKNLEKANISLVSSKTRVEIERSRGLGDPKIFVSGNLVDCTINDIRKILFKYGLKNLIIRVYGQAHLKEIEQALLESQTVYKPMIILVNKSDLSDRSGKIKLLQDYAGEENPILAVSAVTGEGLENLGLELLRALQIIRVYTKEPNKKDSTGEPFILKEGSSIGDLASNIHSYLYTNYKYARIWGPSSKFPGEKVGINHILTDQDVVEIHTR